nr:hypothetical protein [Gammaproteobacteria bacterium]
MMRYAAVFLALAAHTAIAQEVTVTYFDHPGARDDLGSEAWQQQLRRAKANWDKHKAEQGITRPETMHTVELEWPLRDAITVQDNTVQQTSFFLDHDDSGGLQDWNCGERTYDGHNGVDSGPA